MTKYTLEQWLEYCEDEYFTIGEFREIPIGDTVKLLYLDDDIRSFDIPTEPTEPETVFSNYYTMVFTKNTDWTGDCLVYHNQVLNDESHNEMPFTYLDNGVWKYLADLSEEERNALDDKTLLGWEGPMINWDVLDAMPLIYSEEVSEVVSEKVTEDRSENGSAEEDSFFSDSLYKRTRARTLEDDVAEIKEDFYILDNRLRNIYDRILEITQPNFSNTLKTLFFSGAILSIGLAIGTSFGVGAGISLKEQIREGIQTYCDSLSDYLD